MTANTVLEGERTETPATGNQVDETHVQSKPDVQTFKSVIERHLIKWQVQTVEDLCTPQTMDLIDELATLFA